MHRFIKAEQSSESFYKTESKNTAFQAWERVWGKEDVFSGGIGRANSDGPQILSEQRRWREFVYEQNLADLGSFKPLPPLPGCLFLKFLDFTFPSGGSGTGLFCLAPGLMGFDCWRSLRSPFWALFLSSSPLGCMLESSLAACVLVQ